MGITSSKEEPNEMASLASQIDDIAVNYILNQNTIDLLRLTDKEYYDNLIILTSSIIDKKLNKLELGFLNNRVFGKKTISDIIDVMPASNKIKEKVVYNISKFYIKIIMVYSAIATTIDPQYSYETPEGTKKTFYLKEIDEYKNIPKNVKPILVQLTNPMNLCRKRLDILKNKLDLNVDESFVKINPGEKLCSLKTTSLLTDEVGIKELDSLYYDIFDYETKTWNKRSKKMKQKYNKDLILFYQIFTGKKVKPANIQTFHDIELLDMSTLDSCNDVKFMQDILVKKNDNLVQDYIQKINMIESITYKYRTKLTEILKELFVVKLNDNETKYTLNPELTMDHIILLETETRDTILNLYTSCEKYFIQALITFEKIYDQQVKTLNVERVNYIEKIKTPPPEVLEVTPEPIVGVSGETIGISGEKVGVSGETIGVSGERIGVSGEKVGVSGETVGVSGETVGVSGEIPPSIFGITLPTFLSSKPNEEPVKEEPKKEDISQTSFSFFGQSPPISSNTTSSAPMTSEPMTSAPITSEPMTSAPMTSAPMTSAPMTSTQPTQIMKPTEQISGQTNTMMQPILQSSSLGQSEISTAPVNPVPFGVTPPVNPSPVNPPPVNPLSFGVTDSVITPPVNPVPVNPVPVNPPPFGVTESVNPSPIIPPPFGVTAPVNPSPVNPVPVNPSPVNPVPVNPPQFGFSTTNTTQTQPSIEQKQIEPKMTPIDSNPIAVNPITQQPTQMRGGDKVPYIRQIFGS